MAKELCGSLEERPKGVSLRPPALTKLELESESHAKPSRGPSPSPGETDGSGITPGNGRTASPKRRSRWKAHKPGAAARRRERERKELNKLRAARRQWREAKHQAWVAEQPPGWSDQTTDKGTDYRRLPDPLICRVEHDGSRADAKPLYFQNSDHSADKLESRLLVADWFFIKARKHVSAPEDLRALDDLQNYWCQPGATWLKVQARMEDVVEGLSVDEKAKRQVRRWLSHEFLDSSHRGMSGSKRRIERFKKAISVTQADA